MNPLSPRIQHLQSLMAETTEEGVASSWPLHDAVRESNKDKVCALLTSGQAQVDTLDNKKRTALHIAAWKGDADMISTLLKFRANSSLTALDGFTALHFAVQSGSVASCEALIRKNKALLAARVTKGNKSPLHLAIAKGSVPVIQCLLDAGADISAKTGRGHSCLELASAHDAPAVYELIKARYQVYLAQKETQQARRSNKQLETSEGNIKESDKNEQTNSTLETVAADHDVETSQAVSRTDITHCTAQQNAEPCAGSSAPLPVPALPSSQQRKKRKLDTAKVSLSHLECDDDE